MSSEKRPKNNTSQASAKNTSPESHLAPSDLERKGSAQGSSNLPGLSISKSHLRRVSPLGMRVLVRLQRDNNVSDGGLYLPEGAKASQSESVLAEVLEVATAGDHGSEDEANISGVPLGATVLIPKDAGTKVPWDDNLRIIETKEVLAIVHEMSIV